MKIPSALNNLVNDGFTVNIYYYVSLSTLHDVNNVNQ